MQECKSVNCTKRHPEVCKNFKNSGYRRHKEECSYQHVQQIDGEKLKDMLLQIQTVYIKETNNLKGEINQLKDKVDKLEEEIKLQSTDIQTVDQIKPTDTDIENEKNTAIVDNYEKWYHCNMCDYRVKREITLMKHMNTKHSRHDTPDEMSGNVVASCYCDECEYTCQYKKSLKKHKAQNHEGCDYKCNKCEKKFQTKSNLDGHFVETHRISTQENDKDVCICTDSTVCDKCLKEDGWVY
jgi:hypothetical protein